MKNTFALVFLLMFTGKLFASVQLQSEVPGQSITLKFTLGSWQFQQESSGKVSLNSRELNKWLQKGAPEILFTSTAVALDENSEWSISVIDSVFSDFSGVDLIASPGNLKRTQSLTTAPHPEGPVYSTASFWPSSAAALGKPYILRSTRGASVQIFPFTYHPVNNTLRVFSSLTLRIRKTSPLGINPLPSFLRNMPCSSEWNEIFRAHFINPSQALKYNPLQEDGSMLIVCHSDPAFLSAMQPFVKWKTRRGMNVELISYAQAGGSPSALKSYIQNHFPVQAWSFILLVGDAPEISPIYNSNGPSDNEYAYLAGGDSYPELLVGRFSAQTAQEVENMVRKSIWYEREVTPADTWLGHAVGIGSDEGPGDDGQMDWEHQRALGQILDSAGYTNVSELFDGSQGNPDASGNPSASDLGTLLNNNGVGLINYTGHGSNSSIVTTGFSNTDILNLTNSWKLPLFISVGCVNGEFNVTTCFAENWLRAGSGQQATGAAATLMSTINQSWNPPMEGQDEMVNLIANSYQNNIKRTFGGICMNGCMQMNDTYGPAGDEMTDTWCLFGDPSLLVRTATPQPMIVSHPAAVVLGTSNINVGCSFSTARITLVQNNQILSSQLSGGANTLLNFSPLTSLDTIFITVVGYNQVTYQGYILVISPNSAFVTNLAPSVNDVPNGNGNAQADYGEDVMLSVTLQNLGTLLASGVEAILRTSDPNISAIIDSTEAYGDIAAGTGMLRNDAFRIQTNTFIQDGYIAQFQLFITDTLGQSWNSNFSLILHAPQLETSSWQIQDTGVSGNGNGRLDAGETVNIQLICSNSGTSASPSANIELTENSPFVTITNSQQVVGVLGANTIASNFTVQVSPMAPVGANVDFGWILQAGPYQSIGNKTERISLTVEDFESGTMTAFPWTASGVAPWFSSPINPYAGAYCSQSGTIGDSQFSSMEIQLQVVQSDSVIFMHRESCEDGWDFLRFFIDGIEQDQWTGNNPWTRAAFPLAPGNRILRWTYEKDVYLSDYSDCAWVDEIIFPVQSQSGTSQAENHMVNHGSLWNIGPNPNTGNILNINTLKENLWPVEICVFSPTGQLIQQEVQEAAETYLVSLQSIPAGVYLLQIRNGQDQQIYRLVRL